MADHHRTHWRGTPCLCQCHYVGGAECNDKTCARIAAQEATAHRVAMLKGGGEHGALART